MMYPKPEIDRKTAMKLWEEERSDYAKEQAVLNNVGMIVIVLRSLNLDLSDEDLFQIGMVGLVKAVNTFDSGRGVKFSAYATPIIRNEILMSLRKKRIIPMYSLDEGYQLGNGESVPYADIVSSGERFEQLSDFEIDLEVFFDGLRDRERKVVTLYFRGATQRDISREIGISQSMISRILKGTRKRWRRYFD